jgi:hypothetical protein
VQSLSKITAAIAAMLCIAAGIALAQDELSPTPPPLEVLISVADQKLVLLRDGGVIAKYKVSTSRFGVGDSYGSYKTPVGRFRVCDKIGGDLASGAVIKHRSATGEVIPVNAPGRDPIVTRVIWLDGLEEQNRNARARGIYIHGTPEESNLGRPVSWGCIRMRSDDVVTVFEEVPTGTPVEIIADRLPRLHKYKPPPPPEIIVSSTPAPTPVAKQTPPVVAKQSPTPAVVASTKLTFFAKQNSSQPPVAEQKATPMPSHVVSAKIVPDENSPIARISQQIAAMNSETAKPVKPSANPEAWRAMKGSILTAGLAGAPSVTAPKSADKETQPRSVAASAVEQDSAEAGAQGKP